MPVWVQKDEGMLRNFYSTNACKVAVNREGEGGCLQEEPGWRGSGMRTSEGQHMVDVLPDRTECLNMSRRGASTWWMQLEKTWRLLVWQKRISPHFLPVFFFFQRHELTGDKRERETGSWVCPAGKLQLRQRPLSRITGTDQEVRVHFARQRFSAKMAAGK